MSFSDGRSVEAAARHLDIAAARLYLISLELRDAKIGPDDLASIKESAASLRRSLALLKGEA